jgi:hypothetical protein
METNQGDHMKIFKVLVLLSFIPLHPSESQEITRTRSGSVIIDLEPGSPLAINYARSKHPIAYKLVHKAMNGNSNAFVIKTIGKSLDKDRDGKLYKELRQTRKLLQEIAEPKKEKNKKLDQTLISEYIIKELSENIVRKKGEAQYHKKQKVVIAIAGVIGTIVTSVSAAVAAYFSHQ